MILGPNDPRAIRICKRYGLPTPRVLPLDEVFASAASPKKKSKASITIDQIEAQMAQEIVAGNTSLLNPSKVSY